jgi:dihydroneopterin aldolase
MDRLSLAGLSVDCIVGVHPSERHMPQPLEIDLTLHLDTRAAAREQRLRETVDYARLWGEVRFLLQASHFLLLESAAEAVATYILAPPTTAAPQAQVHEVTVKLKKPQALSGAGVPTLEIHRAASDAKVVTEQRPYGELDKVFSAHSCGIARLRLGSGRSTPTSALRNVTRSELVLTSGLLLQGRPVAAGTARQWPKGVPHRYDNPSDHEASVLFVDRPAGGDDEEVLTDVPHHQLADVEFTTFFQG